MSKGLTSISPPPVEFVRHDSLDLSCLIVTGSKLLWIHAASVRLSIAAASVKCIIGVALNAPATSQAPGCRTGCSWAVDAPVTSHSRAPYGMFPGCFEQKSYVHSCLSHTWAPYDLYHPRVRPSEAPVGIIRRCCSRGHIRLRAPYGLTRLHTYGLIEKFARLHGYPVRCPCGHRAGPARESSMFFISYGTLRGPCVTRKGAVRRSYGHVRELAQS